MLLPKFCTTHSKGDGDDCELTQVNWTSGARVGTLSPPAAPITLTAPPFPKRRCSWQFGNLGETVVQPGEHDYQSEYKVELWGFEKLNYWDLLWE